MSRETNLDIKVIDTALAVISPKAETPQQFADGLKQSFVSRLSLEEQHNFVEIVLKRIKEHRKELQERDNLMQRMEHGYSIRSTVSFTKLLFHSHLLYV